MNLHHRVSAHTRRIRGATPGNPSVALFAFIWKSNGDYAGFTPLLPIAIYYSKLTTFKPSPKGTSLLPTVRCQGIWPTGLLKLQVVQ